MGTTYLDFLSGGYGVGIGKESIESNVIDSAFIISLLSSNLTDGTTVSDTTTGATYLAFSDAENVQIGTIQPTFYSNGTQAIEMISERNIGGTVYKNGLSLGVDSTGTPVVNFIGDRAKEAWHTVLRPEVLFSGHTNSTVTLLDSAANYEHMKIYYDSLIGGTTPLYGSVCVYNPNGKSVNLFIGEAGANGSDRFPWWKGRDITISGTSITTRTTNRYYDTASSNKTTRTTTAVNNMYIDRVEAW